MSSFQIPPTTNLISKTQGANESHGCRLSHKSVRFAEERNTTLLLSNHYSEEQWVSQEEFHEVKKSMKRKLGEWKLKGYGVLLRDSFDNSHPTVQRSINAFVQLDEKDCVRGVERSLSSHLDQKISQMKSRSIKTVLSHQRLMKKDGVPLDVMREELAVVSRMHSRACVQFARRLGRADELASRDDENVADARKLVDEVCRMQENLKPRTMGVTSSSLPASRAPGRRSVRTSSRAARIA